MDGNVMLDIAIGLSGIYLVLAMLCTAVNDGWAYMINLRAKNLLRGVKAILSDGSGDFAKAILRTPINDMTAGNKREPSVLSSDGFVDGLIAAVREKAMEGAEKGKEIIEHTLTTAEDLRNLVGQMPESDTKQALSTLLQNVGGDIQNARQRLEQWYDDGMVRVSNWYGRHMKTIALWTALGLAVVMDADTLTITKTLWHDRELRAQSVEMVERTIENAQVCMPSATAEGQPQGQFDRAKCNELLRQTIVGTESIRPLPLGWTKENLSKLATANFWLSWEWLFKVLGWTITAFAVSQGAPFWFDLLGTLRKARTAKN